jgi:hypothetical protein
MTDEQQVGAGDVAVGQERRGARRRSLRRQWWVALAVMLALVISTGVSALVSSHFVVARFASSATELETTSAYTVRLEAAITAHKNLAHTLLANGPVEPAQVLAAQRTAEAEFAAGGSVFHEAEVRDALDEVHKTWSDTVAEVGLWGQQVLEFTPVAPKAPLTRRSPPALTRPR